MMLDILRKPTTRRHRPSEAVEVQVAKRPVDVVMQQRNPAIRHRRTEREQKEAVEVQVTKRGVDVVMQQRNPAIRHRRTEREQKESFVRIQSRQLQSVMLYILRKPTTRRHLPSEAVELNVANRFA